MTTQLPTSSHSLTREQLFRRVVEILLAQEKKPLSIAVFGSWARGDNRPDSDLDVLVEYDGIGMYELIGHWLCLKEALSMEVDLLTPGSFRKLKYNPSADLVTIYSTDFAAEPVYGTR
jgi:predicted nucleotidyltransferase